MGGQALIRLSNKALGNLSSRNIDWTPTGFKGLEMGTVKAAKICPPNNNRNHRALLRTLLERPPPPPPYNHHVGYESECPLALRKSNPDKWGKNELMHRFGYSWKEGIPSLLLALLIAMPQFLQNRKQRPGCLLVGSSFLPASSLEA